MVINSNVTAKCYPHGNLLENNNEKQNHTNKWEENKNYNRKLS